MRVKDEFIALEAVPFDSISELICLATILGESPRSGSGNVRNTVNGDICPTKPLSLFLDI